MTAYQILIGWLALSGLVIVTGALRVAARSRK